MVTTSGHRLVLAAVICRLFRCAPARPRRAAQSSIGFSGGASIDPTQIYAGVYWESPDIGGRFRLRPGIDGGFGDDLRLGTINIDLIAKFPLGTVGMVADPGRRSDHQHRQLHRHLRRRAPRAARRRQLPVRLSARQRLLHRVPGRRRQLRAAAEDRRRLGRVEMNQVSHRGHRGHRETFQDADARKPACARQSLEFPLCPLCPLWPRYSPGMKRERTHYVGRPDSAIRTDGDALGSRGPAAGDHAASFPSRRWRT